MIDIDSIKTALDIGVGVVALYYVNRLQKVIDNHDVRIRVVEKKVGV